MRAQCKHPFPPVVHLGTRFVAASCRTRVRLARLGRACTCDASIVPARAAKADDPRNRHPMESYRPHTHTHPTAPASGNYKRTGAKSPGRSSRVAAAVLRRIPRRPSPCTAARALAHAHLLAQLVHGPGSPVQRCALEGVPWIRSHGRSSKKPTIAIASGVTKCARSGECHSNHHPLCLRMRLVWVLSVPPVGFWRISFACRRSTSST